MDTLFNELLEQIASLHTVGQAALNGPLSAKGQRDKRTDGPDVYVEYNI